MNLKDCPFEAGEYCKMKNRIGLLRVVEVVKRGLVLENAHYSPHQTLCEWDWVDKNIELKPKAEIVKEYKKEHRRFLRLTK